MRGQLNYLNDSQCKAAKPKDKDYRLNDGGGMYLLIRPNGSKLWRMKYSVNGKTKLASFGKYPDVELADARDKRSAARKLVAKNIDPNAVKQEVRRAAKETFRVVAKEWHNLMKKSKWSERHARTIWDSLKADAFPKLGDQPVAAITSTMVLVTASAVADERGAYDVARRVLRSISNVLEYAAVTDYIPVNPAIGVMKYMPENKRDRRHMAAINWKDLPAFLEAIDKSDMFVQTELALRFLMFTFVRPGELRFAKWNEFDGNSWVIPAERMKTKIKHEVPLPTQAKVILERLKALAGGSDFLLPGRSTVMKPISENTLLYAIYRIGYKNQMTAHGFRTLASSWLNEEGKFLFGEQLRSFNPDAIERQLSHGEPNKIRDAYNRADYMGERKVMMQVWADYVDQCADKSGKVVDIRSAS